MGKYDFSSDEELQKLAVQGDSLAEELLIKRYLRLVRVCSRPHFLVGGDSEDLIQEAMFGLLSAVRSFRSDKSVSFKTYAEACVRNRIISAIRSASRNKHEPLNSGVSFDDVLSDESANLGISAFQRVPEEQVLARESAQEFISAYKRCLSDFESQVLELYLRGLSYSEIAVQLSRDSKAIDNAVQRIRRKLADTVPGDNSEC